MFSSADWSVMPGVVRAWRKEISDFRAERRQVDLVGEARVLALADAMRAVGGGVPHRLYHESVEAFKRGEITFDQVTPLYRHAMIHAGAIVRKATGRAFLVCPECEARL